MSGSCCNTNLTLFSSHRSDGSKHLCFIMFVLEGLLYPGLLEAGLNGNHFTTAASVCFVGIP